MLTYVFWHQRDDKVTREEYQSYLIAYHQILREQQPQGFHFSLVLEMSHLPWMAEGPEIYEDWYIVENSAALDPLDEAAVSGICREPHNRVARLAGDGTGGLYRLKSGTVNPKHLAEIRYANWFSKRPGMNYDTLYTQLRDCDIERQGTLWQRQMTLGPGREYCLHTSQSATLPDELTVVRVEANPIFTPAG